MSDPVIPEYPAQNGAQTSHTDDGDGRDALLIDANEAADKDQDGANVLYDDR